MTIHFPISYQAPEHHHGHWAITDSAGRELACPHTPPAPELVKLLLSLNPQPDPEPEPDVRERLEAAETEAQPLDERVDALLGELIAAGSRISELARSARAREQGAGANE